MFDDGFPEVLKEYEGRVNNSAGRLVGRGRLDSDLEQRLTQARDRTTTSVVTAQLQSHQTIVAT